VGNADDVQHEAQALQETFENLASFASSACDL
jgi:hypothetical protein